MILIEKLFLNDDCSKIIIRASTDESHHIKKLYFYRNDDILYDKKIDLSNKLSGLDNQESIEIPVKEIGNDANGILFFTFKDDNHDIVTGVISNYTSYYNCILNKLLKVSVDGCKPVFKNLECEPCQDNLFYADLILNNINNAIMNRYFDEAFEMIRKLDSLCELSCDCKNKRILKSPIGISTTDNLLYINKHG